MRCVLVNDERTWNEMFSQLTVSEFIAFDTETTHLDTLHPEFKCCGLCLAVDETTGYYVPLNHKPPVNTKGQRLLVDPLSGEAVDKLVQLPQDWVVQEIKPLLETKPVLGHSLKFDYQVARTLDITLRNVQYDSMAAAHIIDERTPLGLKELVERYLGYRPMTLEQATGRKYGKKKRRGAKSYFEYVPLERATAYAAPDAVNVLRLRKAFRPYFFVRDENNQLIYNKKFTKMLRREVRLIPITAETELIGTWLDTGHLVETSNQLTAAANVHRQRVIDIVGDPLLNPGSKDQIWEIIYKKMFLKFPGKKDKDDASRKGMLERAALEKMTVQVRSDTEKIKYGRGRGWTKGQVLDFLEAYQNMTKLEKLEGTYTHTLIDQISGDGRLHTLFNQFGTKSGRYSSEQPNFQNMPRNTDPKSPTAPYDIRKAFRADPGWVYILCDYSQMEMRICAAASGCPALTPIILGERKDARGEPIDIHLYTAAEAFGFNYDEGAAVLADESHPQHKFYKEKRQTAKPVNFGIIYGRTKHGLAAGMGVTVQEADGIVQGYMRAYPGVAAWMGDVKRYVKDRMFTETKYGRRRRTSWAEVNNRKYFGRAYRACLNHIIQGSGADVVKKKMIEVHEALLTGGYRGRIVGQIHDEIIVMCPEEEYEAIAKMMVAVMYDTIEWDGRPMVPLPAEAEVKRTWSKKEKAIWKWDAQAV
jgi:DNA polymerase-1